MRIMNSGCECGIEHKCDINKVIIEIDALKSIEKLTKKYNKILLVADNNTYPLIKDNKYINKIINKIDLCLFNTSGFLIPNEESIDKIERKLNNHDLIIGVGSGVINDLCKYVSFKHDLPYFIIASAPSMDGYASSGSALILEGMKVTIETHGPSIIIGDITLLKNAPIDMIKAGIGDIIGKFSALNDWKLSSLINKEYFCDEIYNTVLDYANKVKVNISHIINREEEYIKLLMNALVDIGICMSYVNNSRPASGSEHHIAHYFEISGILNNESYSFHGIDVLYGTYISFKLRQELLNKEYGKCQKFLLKDIYTKSKIEEVYSSLTNGIIDLQNNAGFWNFDYLKLYKSHEKEIKKIFSSSVSTEDVIEVMNQLGLPLSYYNKIFNDERVDNAIRYSMLLKNRYTVLWLYNYIINDC